MVAGDDTRNDSLLEVILERDGDLVEYTFDFVKKTQVILEIPSVSDILLGERWR